ncbi:MAG: GNAT family protein [Burkholderiaceae bacterium]
MPFEAVDTERLILRAPREADLAAFLAYRNHPANCRYQGLEATDAARAAAFLRAQATLDLAAGDCWMMCALERRADGRMIGEVGMYIGGAQSSGDIGWSIHPDFQGHGYATEAARALLDYAFGTRGLHRVTANGDARNGASTRVMERLGMRREGFFLQSRLADGAWQDEVRYALLREEWRP